MSRSEREKRVSRLAFLGTLAGGLAHEVKNPLSTMSLNLQLLREDWADTDSPKEARALKRIDVLVREIGRLEAIVNDFLGFARGFSLAPEPSQINEIIREMVEFLGPEAARMKIGLSTFLSPDLPLIMLDRKYVQKALLNLLYNSFQAMDEQQDGKREVWITSRPVQDGVEVEIADSGPGIDPELQEKIFQVFYSTKKAGTGMGLPTVRRIVEEHDGTIELRSEMGKGTSFSLFFPHGSE